MFKYKKTKLRSLLLVSTGWMALAMPALSSWQMEDGGDGNEGGGHVTSNQGAAATRRTEVTVETEAQGAAPHLTAQEEKGIFTKPNLLRYMTNDYYKSQSEADFNMILNGDDTNSRGSMSKSGTIRLEPSIGSRLKDREHVLNRIDDYGSELEANLLNAEQLGTKNQVIISAAKQYATAYKQARDRRVKQQADLAQAIAQRDQLYRVITGMATKIAGQAGSEKQQNMAERFLIQKQQIETLATKENKTNEEVLFYKSLTRRFIEQAIELVKEKNPNDPNLAKALVAEEKAMTQVNSFKRSLVEEKNAIMNMDTLQRLGKINPEGLKVPAQKGRLSSAVSWAGNWVAENPKAAAAIATTIATFAFNALSPSKSEEAAEKK